MKKSISILTTAILCAGMCSFPVYANAADEKPKYTCSTPEELLDILVSEDEELTDGEAFYPENYKIDVINRGNNSYDIVIYGLKSINEISEIEEKSRRNGCLWAGYPEKHSGVRRQFGSVNVKFEFNESPSVFFFVKDTLTDFMGNKRTLLDAAQVYDFDVAPYVCTNIIPGDTDFDGTITPADASTVLSAYSMLSTLATGKELIFNSTIFDYNNDGQITPIDASMVLSEYAALATT